MKFLNFLLSGYCFFFRYPAIKIKFFNPNGILLGGYLQSIMILFWGSILNFFFNQELTTFIAIILTSIFTGFFHEDGFADTADSLGISKMNNSEETIKKLNHAMKDSTLGSFGVTALSILWIFRALYSYSFKLTFLDISVIYLITRTIPLTLAVFNSRKWSNVSDSKSSQYLRDVSRKYAIILSTFILIPTLFITPLTSFGKIIIIIVSCISISQLALNYLSNRMNSLSGDLIGGTICFCEIITAILSLYI